KVFDLRPAAIIKDLDLLRPIYRQTAAYGHFGRTDLELPWESLERVDALREAVGLYVEWALMPKKTPASVKPVVRVLPLLGVSHLDRPFDYLITEDDSEAAQPGVRVRIRFNGRLVDALLLQRLSESDFDGKLAFIDRVISPFQVYPPQLASLVDALADRYGGNRSDIIRFAIPPRHAKAEEADLQTPFEELGEISEPDLSSWSAYQFGESFVDFVLD